MMTLFPSDWSGLTFIGFDYSFRGTATPVPEPGTLGLLATGLVGLRLP